MPPNTRERPGGHPGALSPLSLKPSGAIVPPSAPETRLDAALDYLARGWALLPIRPGSKESCGCWDDLAENAAPEAEVRRWFDRPDINLGVFVGKVSHRLAVLDIDYGDKPQSNGATAPEALLEYVASLDTPVVWTPSGGLHIYARSARLAELSNPKRDFNGTTVEVKARKGYVLAPPSRLDNGVYRFAKPLEGSALASVDEVLADLEGLFSQLPERTALRSKTNHLTSRCSGAAKAKRAVSKPKAENQREARGLERWDANPDFVQAFVDLLDIRTEVEWERGTSTTFRCVMHEEEHPSARLFRSESGVWVYVDYHQHDDQLVYSLVDVYARVKHGVRRKPTRNQRAAWKLRMLRDTGFFFGDHIELPLLPDDLSREGLMLLQGFVLLRALQWAYRPEWRGNPAAFARSFGARWCRLPERRFDSARRELIEKGLLVPVDECAAGSKGRTTKLFNLPAYANIEKGGRMADRDAVSQPSNRNANGKGARDER